MIKHERYQTYVEPAGGQTNHLIFPFTGSQLHLAKEQSNDGEKIRGMSDCPAGVAECGLSASSVTGKRTQIVGGFPVIRSVLYSGSRSALFPLKCYGGNSRS